MTLSPLKTWLQERVIVASPIFGVCGRCIVFSATVAALGGVLLGAGLAAEVWTMAIAGGVILGYGGTLCLVHLAFFIARAFGGPRAQS